MKKKKGGRMIEVFDNGERAKCPICGEQMKEKFILIEAIPMTDPENPNKIIAAQSFHLDCVIKNLRYHPETKIIGMFAGDVNQPDTLLGGIANKIY